MYWAIISAAMALTAAICAGIFWSRVSSIVAGWLRERGLEKSFLMAAWVELDRIAVGIRSRIKIKGNDAREIQISEEILTLDQIGDPEVKAALLKTNRYQRSVLPLIT